MHTFFAVSFMSSWVVWNACFSYIYEFFGELKNCLSIVYYEVFLTLRAKFFLESFVQPPPGKVVVLQMQTLKYSWEIVTPASVVIRPPGEIKEK